MMKIKKSRHKIKALKKLLYVSIRHTLFQLLDENKEESRLHIILILNNPVQRANSAPSQISLFKFWSHKLRY